LLAGAVLLELVAIAYTSTLEGGPTPVQAAYEMPARFGGDPMLNTEQLGWVLYTEYLIPFELASMLLLVAMIGAIVLAKKNL
jgi:NADH-quinone oxidoreductase subunit J